MNDIVEIRKSWNKSAQAYGKAKQVDKFLKGPVPWWWIEKAVRLPGSTLHVGLALWRLSGAMKSDTVRLANSEMEALGVDRNAKSRALKQLQKRGLVSVQQDPGKILRWSRLSEQ
jgi:DNA-binding MarR family transcriptional regulator